MAQRYCEVALPVPLRTTFVYALPEDLNGEAMVGRRVVVPFRNRAMTGIALAELDQPPEEARLKSPIKEVAEVIDPVPALPEKLMELGRWISQYYLAPIGEAFRAMLPPEVELRHDREYALTAAGRAYLEELGRAPELGDIESAERKLLRHFEQSEEPLRSAAIHRQAGRGFGRRAARAKGLSERAECGAGA